MIIKRIEITNFKSFKELKVDLGRFNVLIGANASGKSNFVEIFKFIRDIANYGLENAISMQGDIEYLRNIKIGASENFSLKIVSEVEYGILRRQTKKGSLLIKIYETIYDFSLKFKKRGRGFEIVRDNLIQKCKFVKIEKDKKRFREKEEIGRGEIILSRDKKNIRIRLDKPKNIPISKDDIYPPFLREEKLPPNMLLLESPFAFPLRDIFSEISVYYIDPKLSKEATPISGKAELEENGSNLSIILKNILKDKEKKRKLFNLVKDLLPFINDLDVEKFVDKSLFFKLQEIYSENQYLPASLISDGTINIIALIIALYFEEKPIIIIEEPERNIHPYLISKVIDMMKEVSNKKQIIITTHNPEIVKYAGLENILLVSRDKDGFSTISRPLDKEHVKIFLKNKIGIDELYVKNLLEV